LTLAFLKDWFGAIWAVVSHFFPFLFDKFNESVFINYNLLYFFDGLGKGVHSDLIVWEVLVLINWKYIIFLLICGLSFKKRNVFWSFIDTTIYFHKFFSFFALLLLKFPPLFFIYKTNVILYTLVLWLLWGTIHEPAPTVISAKLEAFFKHQFVIKPKVGVIVLHIVRVERFWKFGFHLAADEFCKDDILVVYIGVILQHFIFLGPKWLNHLPRGVLACHFTVRILFLVLLFYRTSNISFTWYK